MCKKSAGVTASPSELQSPVSPQRLHILCSAQCAGFGKNIPLSPSFLGGKGGGGFVLGFLVLGSCMSELETAALSCLLTPESGLRGRSQAQGGTPLVKSTVCHIWYQCPSFGSWLHLHPSVQRAGMVNAAVVVAGKERRAGFVFHLLSIHECRCAGTAWGFSLCSWLPSPGSPSPAVLASVCKSGHEPEKFFME